MVGMGLLVADLFLPVPGTVVMSGLGWVYGRLLGGCLAALGSFLSGMAAYGLCRSLGDTAVRRILGQKDLERSQHLAHVHGPWFIAVSRALPLLPEITTCMAGLTRMPLRRFLPALAAGSLPTGFVYAAIGSLGGINAGWALALSIALPVGAWFMARSFLR